MMRVFNNRTNRLTRIVSLVLLLLTSFGVLLAPTYARSANTTATGQTTLTGTTRIPNIPANPYGVNVFLHKEVEPWKIEQTLRMAAAANIQWIKQEFPWNEIEFKKGYFHDDKWDKSSWEKFDNIVNMADKYHLTIIARVDHPPAWAKADAGGDSPLKSYGDLADFANALLDHYKGRINHVQIWNEPNLAAEWIPGTPVEPSSYIAMLKAAYPAIKAAHPNAVVLSAPMAMTLEGPSLRGNMNEIDYWTKLYQAGVKGNFDIASANGYGLDQPPEDPPSPKVLNFRRVELLRDIMVKNSDNNVPIWFDEYGWNASPETLPEEEKNFWRHVTLQKQAEWTVAGVDYARKNWPWAGVISVWYFRQVGDIPPTKAEYYFQMVDPEFVPQPIYDSVKVHASTFPGPSSQELPTVANPSPTLTSTSAAGSTPEASVTSATGSTAGASPGATPGAEATATTTPPVAGSTGNSALILYIVGGLLVVGGLAGLGYYFAKGRAS